MAGEASQRDYRAWLLRQPCACQPCVAPVVIHHSTVGETEQHSKSLGGRRGKGQRASDAEGISVCHRHHANFHELRGYFAGWEKQQLRDWQNQQVDRLQRLHAMAHPEPIHATGKSDKPKRGKPGAGWSVPLVLDLLRKESRHRTGEVSAAFSELADLIERDTVQ